MMRVLKPGGRIAILTSHAHKVAPIRHTLTAGARAIGLTMFDLFSSAGRTTDAACVRRRQKARMLNEFSDPHQPSCHLSC